MTFQYARRRGLKMRPSNPFRYDYEQLGVNWRIINSDIPPMYQNLKVVRALEEYRPETIPLFIYNFEKKVKKDHERPEDWIRDYNRENVGTQLNWAFTFAETPEGHEFWCKIRDYLYENYL